MHICNLIGQYAKFSMPHGQLIILMEAALKCSSASLMHASLVVRHSNRDAGRHATACGAVCTQWVQEGAAQRREPEPPHMRTRTLPKSRQPAMHGSDMHGPAVNHVCMQYPAEH